MTTLIERLEQLNRKERFLLMQAAIGKEQFVLGEEFRKAVGAALKLNIPAGAFFAIDYHLDWLYVAIISCLEEQDLYPNDIGINQNQEDIDLLIAFDEGDVTHLVLIEAKGVTSWGRGQIASKLRRLLVICEALRRDPPILVQTHFLLTAPYKSEHLTRNELTAIEPGTSLPDWVFVDGALPWIVLKPQVQWLAPVRWDEDRGKGKDGKHWKLRPYRPKRSTSHS